MRAYNLHGIGHTGQMPLSTLSMSTGHYMLATIIVGSLYGVHITIRGTIYTQLFSWALFVSVITVRGTV